MMLTYDLLKRMGHLGLAVQQQLRNVLSVRSQLVEILDVDDLANRRDPSNHLHIDETVKSAGNRDAMQSGFETQLALIGWSLLQ